MEAILVIALLLLFAAVATLAAVQLKQGGQTTEARFSDDEAARVVAALRAEVSTLQSQVLQQSNEQFVALAKQTLGAETARGEEHLKARQTEIDKGLVEIRNELTRVRDYVSQVDTKRGESLAKLGVVVDNSRKAAEALNENTAKLNEALAGGQARGQWGERMAEDVLRVAGFVEGLQYRKQTQLAESGGRPDFTFLLPDQRVLHMDVKFPLAEYMRYLRCESDSERQTCTRAFMRDVKNRIKEVTTRDYIDPANGTLDYTLVFIPNEQVYGFIQENDPGILDYALQQRVVVCSPLTLFAILAVVRQSTDNFRLARQTDEILKVLGSFNKQWDMFKKGMGDVDKHLDSTRKAYDKLLDTRSRMLDAQVTKVERLRAKTGIDNAELASGDTGEISEIAEIEQLEAGELQVRALDASTATDA